MKNPLRCLDDALMYGANKAVHAWNWTTGRTKVDLANGLVSVAPALEISGLAVLNPSHLIIFAPLALINSVFASRGYKKVEEGEARVQDSGALDFKGEEYKQNCAYFYGPWWLTCAGLNASSILFAKNPLGHEILATGFGIRATSHYVIRADYLPPRKNVLSRAKDKLVELVEKYKTEPAIIPSPVI